MLLHTTDGISTQNKVKRQRNKPVCPTTEQKVEIVSEMFKYRDLLFFEEPNSLRLVQAKDQVLKVCHSIGCMYTDYPRLKKAYRDWRDHVFKEIKASKQTGQGAPNELSELARIMIEMEHGNKRFDKHLEVCQMNC